MWQDLLFTGGQTILAAVLLPTLLDEEASVPRWTSVPTMAVLYAFALGYVTLGLPLSAVTTAIAATGWGGIVLWRNG